MNPYEVLELLPGASTDEIKSAYHRLAKHWHPDRYNGAEKEAAEVRFRELAEAFSQLKDPVRRQAIVTQAQEGAGPTPTPLRERTAEEWYAEAREERAAGQSERALGLIQMALRMAPRHPAYLVLYGEMLVAIGGDERLALKSLEQAQQLDPQNVDACLLLAELYERQGMPARAQKMTQTAREIAPDHKHFRKESRRTARERTTVPGLGDQFRALFQRIFHRG